MHPILFRIGSFEVGTYGLMLALGFLAALWLAKRLARQDGLAPDAMVDISLTVLIAGIVGAKALMILVGLFSGESLSQVFSLSMLRAGGAVHGGILAGVAAFFWRVRVLKLPFAKTLDSLSAAVPLGQAIGRLGCLAAGCCYGSFCQEPWAITFHNYDAARFGTPLGEPLHPVQAYFGLSNLIILAVLLTFRRFRKFPGQIAYLYFILEGLFRLVLETWRGDIDRGFWLNVSWLSTGRITAIIFILIGVGIWVWSSRAVKPPAARAKA
ncbi:MAG: prolipoprotein diacylglyceryl transferase [Holophagales bacterium]|jgi:phosphatidylglycerol:prolipoprotein diacylglycerol transferase|nr:prolipoprotein diacylglyceryl transferase [Holophagales bacterium]